MDILQSTLPTFRYRWRWTPTANLPSHLAATRVVVLYMDPSAVYQSQQANFERLARRDKAQGPAGPIELEEVRAGATALSRRIAQELLLQGIGPVPYAEDLEPMRGLIRDSVAFHTDMPMWTNVFAAWCLHGPERVLHFPMMGLSLPFRPGTFVLFDPAQPHGLLRPGQEVFDPESCEQPENIAMLNFTFVKKGVMAELLDCGLVPGDASAVLHTEDQYRPDSRMGQVRLSAAPAAACDE